MFTAGFGEGIGKGGERQTQRGERGERGEGGERFFIHSTTFTRPLWAPQFSRSSDNQNPSF